MTLAEQIERAKTGWLSPDLQFYPVKMYKHLQTALELPVSPALRSYFNELAKDLLKIEEDCKKLGNMLRYEEAANQYYHRIRLAMLLHGWMRVFVMDNLICIDGNKTTIHAKAQTIQSKLESLNMKIEWLIDDKNS